MTSQIAPSILSFDLSDLHEVVADMDRFGASILHLDIMDGQFVPPITIGDAFIKSLRPHSKAVFEAHLMAMTPERHFEAFKEAGCDRILFHVEATIHSHRLVQTLRSMDVSPGVVLNPGTPVEAILPILDIVDMVLVMTVNPGWGGQKFLPSMLDKVRQLRELGGPDLLIEVDGGIVPETLPLALTAGANVFVVGNHLAKAPHLGTEIQNLLEICKSATAP